MLYTETVPDATNFFDFAEKHGFALFPIQPDSKIPFKGCNWKKKASKDPARWRQWASDLPGCNWAMYAAASGLIVADIDVKVGAAAAWAAWCKVCEGWGLLGPLQPTVTTPSGGFHVYLTIPNGVDPYSLRQPALVPGVIDLRVNGYVLVPPSKIGVNAYSKIEVSNAL